MRNAMLSFPSSILITYIFILLAMAFFTLFERKILGYAQIRKGPNKVSLMGLPQPLADAAKLISKEITWPQLSNKMLFALSPIMTLILALMLWVLAPSWSPIFSMKFGILFFLCVSSLSVYTILAAGWSSNSNYSLLGSLRSIAQTISYEVSMSLILISPLIMIMIFNTHEIYLQTNFAMMLMCPPLLLLWMTTILAETNRTPFDLSEGESELVSGFNTEYSGGLFTIIFMAEYLNIIMMSVITSILFLNNLQTLELNSLMFIMKTLFFSFTFIWARATLPRMRYDFLMNLTWKGLLPFSLFFMLLMLSIY